MSIQNCRDMRNRATAAVLFRLRDYQPLFPNVGTIGVILATELTTIRCINLFVTHTQASCQYVGKSCNFYFFSRGSDICLFHNNGPPLPLASPPLWGEDSGCLGGGMALIVLLLLS